MLFVVARIGKNGGKPDALPVGEVSCAHAVVVTRGRFNPKNAFSELGDIEVRLKDAAFAAADAIDQITEAFKEDGPEGATEAAGEIMANLLTGIAEALPDVINTAVAVIDAFIDGIVENKDQLLKAAGEIATALVEGLVKLLPKEIGDPIQEVFEDIGKSLQKGGLKKGIEAAIKIF